MLCANRLLIIWYHVVLVLCSCVRVINLPMHVCPMTVSNLLWLCWMYGTRDKTDPVCLSLSPTQCHSEAFRLSVLDLDGIERNKVDVKNPIPTRLVSDCAVINML